MTENIPPPGSAGVKAALQTSDSLARGLPYYEKLRRDLRDTIQKKRILDKNMSTLEDQIYRTESSYLEDTSAAGNIIKGFDNYIKSSALPSHHHSHSSAAGTISGSAAGGGSGMATSSRRKPLITDNDRVFSRSSTSYMRDSDSPSSATTTPGHAQQPTGGFASAVPGTAGLKANGDKKKKKASAIVDESENDGKPNKRARISYGQRD